MTRRRRSSPYLALSNLLKGILQISRIPDVYHKRIDTYRLEQVKIEREKLKLQHDQAEIARKNNAVLLQDLQIELAKLKIEREQRKLGVGADEINPPYWDG